MVDCNHLGNEAVVSEITWYMKSRPLHKIKMNNTVNCMYMYMQSKCIVPPSQKEFFPRNSQPNLSSYILLILLTLGNPPPKEFPEDGYFLEFNSAKKLTI